MKKITKLTIALLINIMLILNTPLYSMAILEEQTPTLIIAANEGGTTSDVSSVDDIIIGADNFISLGDADQSTINMAGVNDLHKMISGTLLTIAVAVTLISSVIIGINFVIQSVEGKAKIKESMVPWIIGIVISFGAYGIWNITMRFLDNSTSDISNIDEEVQISLNKTNATLKIGENEEIILSANITSDIERVVSWTSSNNLVAIVDSNGKVTAKSEGTAIINATIGKAKATCVITVEGAKTVSIKLSENMLTLNAKLENPTTLSHQLTATLTPNNSKEPILWSSSNTKVATVSNGKIIAKGKGETIITAKSGEKLDTCTVKVESEKIYETRFYNPSTNQVSDKRTSYKDLEFVLYIPEISYVKNINELPLIVQLHGGQLTSARKIITSNPFGLENTNYGAVCIFPISPYVEGKLGWREETDERIQTLKGLIDYSTQNYNVNKNKIALTGFSNGGAGTWHIGIKYPTLFSCLVPVSGYSAKKADIYPDCPVWLVCSSADASKNVADKIATLLINDGGKVKVDDLGKSHSDMEKEAYTPELINWMIERNRVTNNKYQF